MSIPFFHLDYTPPGIWYSEASNSLMVGYVKNTRANYEFEIELNCIRETALHPSEWGWEFIGWL